MEAKYKQTINIYICIYIYIYSILCHTVPAELCTPFQVITPGLLVSSLQLIAIHLPVQVGKATPQVPGQIQSQGQRDPLHETLSFGQIGQIGPMSLLPRLAFTKN